MCSFLLLSLFGTDRYQAACNSANFGPKRRDAHIFSHGEAYGKDCVQIVTAMAPGEMGATSGDTLACRKYHLYIASTYLRLEGNTSNNYNHSITIHCQHASPDGGGVCVDEVYTTDQPQYTGRGTRGATTVRLVHFTLCPILTPVF